MKKLLKKYYKKLIIIILIIVVLILSINFISNKNKKDGFNNCNSADRFYLDNSCYGTNEFISVTANNVDFLNESETNYILYTYNNFCSFSIPVDEIFKEFMRTYNVGFYSISFDEFKNTSLYEEVKYAPSIIIIKDGKIVDYLDTNSDDDYEKYQDSEVFTKWLKEYIYIK